MNVTCGQLKCYVWAIEQSGIDPLNTPKTQAAPAQTGPTGGAVVGAAKGAAAGAAIGAIAGDAGKGAAIGAVAGGLGGRRQGSGKTGTGTGKSAVAGTGISYRCPKEGNFSESILSLPGGKRLYD